MTDAVENEAARGDHNPVRLADGTAELLERSGQLETLQQCLDEAAGPRAGQIVLIRGEAGIGKTAMLSSFCGSVDEPVRVLWAACDPLFTPRPLGPLMDIARSAGVELLAKVEAGDRPHDVAATLLRDLEAGPTAVVVLEDLQWADEATMDVMRLLARRIQSLPVLLVGTYREEAVGRQHPLLQVIGDLAVLDNLTRIDLEPLSPAAVSALAEQSTLDPEELHARTGGNPFFVTEALAAGTALVPETVRDAVLARVARLTPEASMVLEAVAIVPRRTEVWLLEALVDGALDALDECLSSGMLKSEAGGVAFRHELARMTIEQSLTPQRAVRFHRRALSALADPAIGPPDLARLAHHAEAAGDVAAVLRFAPAAAKQAAAVGSPREAQSQYARALRFGTGLDWERRLELLEGFARQCYLTDMRDAAVEAIDEALAIYRTRGDAVRQAHTLDFRAELLGCMGKFTEALGSVREAADVLEQLPGAELLQAHVASELAVYEGNWDAAIHAGRKVIELAELAGDMDILIAALNNVGCAELAAGLEVGREKLERAIALAKTVGEDPLVGLGYINVVWALGRVHRWRDASRYLEDGMVFSRERGLEAWEHNLRGSQARMQLAFARWDDAAEVAAPLLRTTSDWEVTPRVAALLTLAQVRARRGDPGWEPLLDEAAKIAGASSDAELLQFVAVVRSEVLWLEGRSNEIEAETETALAHARVAGKPASAGELELWRMRAGLAIEPPVPAIPEPYLSQLAGDHPRAAANWRELGCPYEAALAMIDSGDPDALRAAHQELLAMGAHPAAAIAARALREQGERRLPRGPRRRTRQNPAGLTAREQDVLELLAEGLRNSEIAQRLVVSQRTVDHHVAAILRKLDARTRGEAVATAGRLGLATRS